MAVASEISIRVFIFSQMKEDISVLSVLLLVLPMDREVELLFMSLMIVLLTTDEGEVDFFLMSVLLREGEADFLLRFVLLPVFTTDGKGEFFFGFVFGVELDFFLMSAFPRE